MHLRYRGALVALICASLLSCTGTDHVAGPAAGDSSAAATHVDLAPASLTLPAVRFSEIHYDNTGTDAGEAIEISGPAGTNLTGWTIVLYNGSGGAPYDTKTLSGTIPATANCLENGAQRGVVTTAYAVNGIQNGSPDGFALVNNGTVVEFLSYEGTFTAVGGAANGMVSVDIGKAEAGTEPLGQSLQRHGNDTWTGPEQNTFGVCNDNDAPPPPPPPPTLPPVRLTEIHYDNTGADVGEAIEVEGPAGTDLTGWTVVLYNATGGVTYATDLLGGTIGNTCTGRGVTVVNYGANGIQNGPADGFALVDNNGHVIEFLSYEGTLTATNGPASGTTSVDIGASEDGTGPVGGSIERDATGAWHLVTTNSFGVCNGFTPPPPPPPSSATLVINELMADPLRAAGGASFGEWFEVYNYGTQPVDMQNFVLTTAGQPSHTIASSVVVPAGGYAVLGRGADVTQNGGLAIDYNYFVGTANTIFLDNTDFLRITDAAGLVVDSVRWQTAATMVKGVTRALKDASQDNANVDGANWGYSTTTFGDGDFGTPHAANPPLTDTPPVVPNFITFTGRLPGDQPLPVGFEDQLFGTLHNGANGATITSSFTWEALTPNIATIDANGVMHALAAGSATFKATATADGSTGNYTLPMEVATLSATALYGNNVEFGTPADGDNSDDFIITRDQYVSSFNKNKNTPNWVSYDLDPTHFGGGDRCDCFTQDPALPASFAHLTTNDYTGAGAVAGFGIDRGHLARSFDRTSGTLDNAYTYLFSNIMPQAADNNQGPWAQFENFLGDQARNSNMEVYIIAGPAGNAGTVKNEGKIVIPAFTWKVAVIMPHDEGLANVHDYRDLTVMAVIMPNVAGIRNVDWHDYLTTVDAVEQLSGYDLLALLPDKVEAAVEANVKPPLGALDGPYTGSEGGPAISMSAAGSVDPNGSIVTYAWDFGDGTTASGASQSHSYAQDGNYTVTLTVTDNDGLTDVVSTTATIGNVAPVVGTLPDATLNLGGTYAADGSFTDPGADTWSGTVNYGDGGGISALPLANKTFALSHGYCTPGDFTVTVRVTDDHATGTQTAQVSVLTASQTLAEQLVAAVQRAVSNGRISQGTANHLINKFQEIAAQIDRGNQWPAQVQIRVLIIDLRGMLALGKLTAADEAAIRTALQGLVGCLN